MANEPASDGVPTAAVVAASVPMLNNTPSENGLEALAKCRASGKKKLAIVGFAPSSYKDAPFQNPEWEVWGLNEAYTLPGFSRADRWFELHLRQEVDVSTRDPNHINWLRAQTSMPLYMIRAFPDIKMSVDYPIRDIVRKYGQYLTNSITYEILLGIEEGFETIGIWGVDMAQGGISGQPSEYAEQRPSCEWACGVAVGKGIHLYIPPASDLLKAPGLYGWEGDGSQMRMKIRGRILELQGRIAGLSQNLSILDRNRLGAIGENAFIDRIATFLKDKPAATPTETLEFCQQMRNQIIPAVQGWEGQIQQMSVQKSQLEGAIDDCLYWLRKYVLPTFASNILAGIDDIAPRSIVLQENPEPLPVAVPASAITAPVAVAA